jgi:hypothetical protein
MPPTALQRPEGARPRGSVRETMPDEIPEEKSYREWLAEALAQDARTWEALEEKVRTMRLKQGILEEKKAPRDC